jgi:hypothetical protein
MMKRDRLTVAAVVMALCMLVVAASCGDDDSTGTGATGSISGTLTFRGPWPATGEIYVTVFAQYPPTGAPDAFSNPIGENQLSPDRTYNYKLSGLEAGTYKSVLVGWREGIGADFCTGLFWVYPDSLGIDASCNAQAPGPSAVTVTKNKTVTHVDMVSDLTLIP